VISVKRPAVSDLPRFVGLPYDKALNYIPESSVAQPRAMLRTLPVPAAAIRVSLARRSSTSRVIQGDPGRKDDCRLADAHCLR
jgi:hypothetical protein